MPKSEDSVQVQLFKQTRRTRNAFYRKKSAVVAAERACEKAKGKYQKDALKEHIYNTFIKDLAPGGECFTIKMTPSESIGDVHAAVAGIPIPTCDWIIKEKKTGRLVRFTIRTCPEE